MAAVAGIPLSADEVIGRAVSRAQETATRASQTAYTYTKLTFTEELDVSGRVKERKEKVYQVVFQDGLTRPKLLSVNGHPPAQKDIKKQLENEANARKVIGKSKTTRGGVNRENFLTPELVARFSFKIIDEEPINGRRAYRVAFEPKRPGPPAHHIVERLLDQLSGTVWIDAEEFEIARAEISLGSEVDLLGGVAGSLKKLAYTLTRTRLDEGLWFNTLSFGDFEGRRLLDWMRFKTRSQSINFRPIG
jgi:hypothetical protein